MSDNALTMFDPKSTQVPAHIGAFLNSDAGANIIATQKVPSLSYEGKTWAISLDGNKTKLTRRNQDGDEEPIAIMRVVIADYAKRRGRAYYEGTYDPNNVSAPICWSDDGIVPDPSLPDTAAEASQPHKVSAKCEGCPMSVKGSKIADGGKAVTACSQHRMLGVIPAHKLDFEPLRLKIAITSDWDKTGGEQEGWFAYQQYLDFLKSRGVTHTGVLVTKIKFDANTAYPKLLFAPDRWLSEDEMATIQPVVLGEEVKKLLGGTYTPAGVDGVPKEAAAPAEQTPAPAPTPAAASSIVIDEPADEPEPAKAEPEKPVAEAAPAASADVPDDVKALLAEWG